MTQDWPHDAIFMVGHSTLPIADFIALLEIYPSEQGSPF